MQTQSYLLTQQQARTSPDATLSAVDTTHASIVRHYAHLRAYYNMEVLPLIFASLEG